MFEKENKYVSSGIGGNSMQGKDVIGFTGTISQ